MQNGRKIRQEGTKTGRRGKKNRESGRCTKVRYIFMVGDYICITVDSAEKLNLFRPDDTSESAV